MTSNVGSHHLLEGVTPDGEIKPEARSADMAELRNHFRPKFLNRIDDIVLFTPLALAEIARIVDLQLGQLRDRLAVQRMTVELTEAARELIARHGFDPVYGARPLRRYISHEVETKIGRALLRGGLGEGLVITVDARDGELVVSYTADQNRSAA